ncbi:uncharacterized protein LOC119723539 [Patiria miniata]|uniref:Integrase catalytic domain-containing protein n=1 Tax=Patiria miniata TaxID=46514 RepID=A0A913ZGP0_PATMI|nr:uncharacterized protein LOC119723539 [Patiria miniata]
MAMPEGLADVIAQSNKALAETLAGAFQNLRYQRAPTIRLAKFNGVPRKSGDQTLREWLGDLDTYARQLGLSGKELVSTAIDHLGGEAKEEVLCCPATEKENFEGLSALLLRRFGSPESVQSLNASFYSRVQEDGETLAEYSRALMRLYGKIESTAEGSHEKGAVVQLKEKALREQLIRGVRDVSVRRELRKLTLDRPDVSFYDLRELALSLLADADEVPEEVDLRAVEKGRSRNPGGATGSTSTHNSGVDNQKLLSELLEGQKQLQTAVQLLVQQQTQMSTQLQSVSNSLQSCVIKSQAQERRKNNRNPVTCTFCHKQGHSEEKCYAKKRAQDASNKEVTSGQASPSGNALPPS